METKDTEREALYQANQQAHIDEGKRMMKSIAALGAYVPHGWIAKVDRHRISIGPAQADSNSIAFSEKVEFTRMEDRDGKVYFEVHPTNFGNFNPRTRNGAKEAQRIKFLHSLMKHWIYMEHEFGTVCDNCFLLEEKYYDDLTALAMKYKEKP